ncbi:MAG TPA: hypothetical protein VJ201_06900 [Candidatus Babeliales bacterium]|nr:hypothetical protein [Candidatus Babeliales bacterium]
MSKFPLSNILVMEPNDDLDTPYRFLDNVTLTRVSTIERGLKYLTQQYPDMVFISASFSVQRILSFLDTLKNASRSRLIPIVMVVDLSHKISNIPGTTWGGKIGILTSLVSRSEYNSTIHRVFHEN